MVQTIGLVHQRRIYEFQTGGRHRIIFGSLSPKINRMANEIVSVADLEDARDVRPITPFSFMFMQFSAKIMQNAWRSSSNNRLAPPSRIDTPTGKT